MGKSHDGSTYTFTVLNLEEKELEVLAECLRKYKHLKNVSVAKNQLKDISEVAALENLLVFNGSENQIESIGFMSNSGLNYLQMVNLTKNKLK